MEEDFKKIIASIADAKKTISELIDKICQERKNLEKQYEKYIEEVHNIKIGDILPDGNIFVGIDCSRDIFYLKWAKKNKNGEISKQVRTSPVSSYFKEINNYLPSILSRNTILNIKK